MRTTTPKSINDPAAIVRRGMRFLLPPHPEGSIAEAEAQMHAWGHLQAAIEQCILGGRDDLAFRLQEIAFELSIPPAAPAPAASEPQPAPVDKPRRKLARNGSPGLRKAKLAKRGCLTLESRR